MDSSLLRQTGGGDAGLRALERYNQSLIDDSDDLDVLEERTNSSDMSSESQRPRVWRPRPPALNEQSFPPLPGAAAAPARSPSRPSRCSSGQRSTSTDGDGDGGLAMQLNKRGGRKKRIAADPPAAAAPARTSAVTSPATSAAGLRSATGSVAEDKSTGRVYVTGITDDNWELVRENVMLCSTLEDSERGSNGDGWLTLSTAEDAEWVVSIFTSDQSGDIPGVTFQLADGVAEHQ